MSVRNISIAISGASFNRKSAAKSGGGWFDLIRLHLR
jgi:hypothetical protein